MSAIEEDASYTKLTQLVIDTEKPRCRTESRYWSVCYTPFFHYVPAQRQLRGANNTTTTTTTTTRTTVAFELSAFNVYNMLVQKAQKYIK